MFYIVASDSLRARTMPVRSPCSRVMPALSMATSVPDAHGDADVGGGEGGGVVDAVAGHRDDSALAAEALDDVALVVGQHLGLDPVDAEAAGRRLRR